jgi:outer membrane immunogenic protein
MRGKWLIGCLLALTGTQSFAADWGGFYAGVNGGFTSMASDWFDQDYYWSGGTFRANSSGQTVGAQFGWNVQKGNTVLGLETDYRAGHIEKHSFPNSLEFKDKLKSLVTLRTRFGLAVDQSLIYGTLGAARGYSWHTWQDLPDRTKFGNYKIGVAYGFGFERKIGARLSLRGEYLAARIPAVTARVSSGGDDVELSNNVSNIGLGLNYHF